MASQKKSITFSDIAQYTGLSKATISRYFNHPSYLTRESIDMISKALKELNYQENKLASVFAKGNSEIIGIIVPNFFYQFYSYFLNHVLNTYEQYGFKFITFLGNNDCEAEKKCLNELLAYQVIGLINLSHSLSSEYLAALNVPVVTVEREDRFISSVNTNNYSGARMAVDLLRRNNCEIYFHVNSPVPPSVPAYGRIQGFTDTCSAYNLQNELILRSFTDNYEEAYACLLDIYQSIKNKYPGKRKGFFFCNDTYAHIFLNILVKHGECIPDEYQIIGFVNSPDSSQSIIPITTISQDIPAIAQSAIDLIAQQISRTDSGEERCNGSGSIQHIVIQPSLIERDTTSQTL